MTDTRDPTPGKNVLTFGKHKGKDILEVVEADQQYIQWLVAQDWFRDKFVTLHQTIINRGSESEETPDHNALQVLFLEDEFCRMFCKVLNRDRELPTTFNRRFEYRGIDVVLEGDYSRYLIEIKPVVSDDYYPAVLRQMRRNGSGVLFTKGYTGVGATREQFIKTFETAGIRIVFLDQCV